MGVAAGDIDNDGCVDLLTTSLDGNRLLRNDCRGVFTDVSARSGLAAAGWSVSAAFVDFDRDGWLDLFVGHYLTWDPSLNTPCYGTSGRRVYCAPQVYRAQQSRLYRNNRDGTLLGRDRRGRPRHAVRAGARASRRPTSTATAGSTSTWPTTARRTSSGSTGTTGRSRTAGSCPARRSGRSGEPKSGMGVDAGDIDDDGDEDLIVTNLTGEGHDLYVNDGTGTFVNASAVSGIGHRSLPYTGFGAGWLDVDNDGWLDLLTVNGAVQIPDSAAADGATASLGQAQQLFRNLGNGRFEDVDAGRRTRPAADATRAAARRSATWTTTATRTSSSPTTAARRSCC